MPHRFKRALLISVFSLALPVIAAEPEKAPQKVPSSLTGLMPWPQQINVSEGQYALSNPLTVSIQCQNSERLQRAVERWQFRLQQFSGQTLPLQKPLQEASGPVDLTVCVSADSTAYPVPETDERYSLVVTAQGIQLNANTVYGAVWGLQTLRQLVQVEGETLTLPQVNVEDTPRFAWRGMLLDSSRHWMPVATVKRLLDAMESVKLNVLHMHLVDDQSFRLESKRYPLLHQKGSDGPYYSHEDIRDLVAYAADRGIRVVPEIGLPGHSQSWQVAYPMLASTDDIETRLGHFKEGFSVAIDPSRQEVYDFIENLIDEVITLFPDPYLHTGGDEINPTAWENNPAIQAFAREQGLQNSHDLQAYFTQRYVDIVRSKGRIAIGWEEVLHPDIAEDTVINLWNKGDYDQVLTRHPILVSFNYYLDMQQPAWWMYQRDPTDFRIQSTPAKDLIAAQQPPVPAILGAEISNWAETIDEHTLDIRTWPRTAAVAERLWSPKVRVDAVTEKELYTRLAAVSRQLLSMGVRHQDTRHALVRLANGGDVTALATLAAVVEPGGYYMEKRRRNVLETIFPPTWITKYKPANFPIERFIDYLLPESTTARHFSEQVERYLANPGDTALQGQLVQQLTLWRDNHQRLATTIAGSPLLAKDDVHLVSKGLNLLAEAGLQAIDAISRGQRLHWYDSLRLKQRIDYYQYFVFTYDFAETLDFYKGFLKPDAIHQNNIAIQPAIKHLVLAASGHSAPAHRE